jgi:hypothetical protein
MMPRKAKDSVPYVVQEHLSVIQMSAMSEPRILSVVQLQLQTVMEINALIFNQTMIIVEPSIINVVFGNIVAMASAKMMNRTVEPVVMHALQVNYVAVINALIRIIKTVGLVTMLANLEPAQMDNAFSTLVLLALITFALPPSLLILTAIFVSMQYVV